MRARVATTLLAALTGAVFLLIAVAGKAREGGPEQAQAVQAPASVRAFVPGAAARALHLPDLPAPELDALCRSDAVAPLSPYSPVGHEGAIAAVIQAYHSEPVDHRPLLQEYSPAGDYLNYSQVNDYLRNPAIRFDSQGIPTVFIGGVYQYNPVTIAQYGLTLYGQVLHGAPVLGEFINVADFLVDWQDERGALPHRFDYPYYLEAGGFRAPWTSGLSQGLALSLFSRAHGVTNDTRYLDAGKRAAAFIPIPPTAGGVFAPLEPLNQRLAGFMTVSEYPSATEAYTLNGFMFAALGLYDWWQLGPSDVDGPHALARRLFECSVTSLAIMVPAYDIGGYSMYDLGPVTHGSEPNLKTAYHAFHIALLHALHGLTGTEIFAEFEHRWAATVD